LNLTRISLVLFIAFVIAFSFTGQLHKEKSNPLAIGTFGKSPLSMLPVHNQFDMLSSPALTHCVPVFSVPLTFEVSVNDNSDALLSNSTRSEIYDFIIANPGVQFRGICNGLGLAVGTAEFHLGVLKRAGLISFLRDGRYKRFFEAKRFSSKEMETISLLRHATSGSILKNLMNKKTIGHGELAFQVSITSQGLTWQMNRLTKAGVVQQSKDGLKVFYSIEEAQIPVLTEMANILGKC